MTDTSTQHSDMNDSLKGGYVLIDLSISRWEDRKPDEALAAELAAAHGGAAEMFAATKKLMAGCQEYKELNSTLNAMRTYIYAETLPWSMAGNGKAKKGPRLAATIKVMNIIADLKHMQDEARNAVLALQAAWPQRVQEALTKQGTAADPTQYPDASELQDLFTVTVDIEPVPTVGDFSKMAIPAQLATALGNRMAKRQNAAVENAMADLTGRIIKYVGNMAEQLTKVSNGEKTRLYSSVVDNVKPLVSLLRTANLTGDTKLTELAEMMDGLIVHDIKTLKNNVSAAGEVAKQAKAVIKKVKAGTVTPEGNLPTFTPHAAVPIADPKAVAPEPVMEMGTQKIPEPPSDPTPEPVPDEEPDAVDPDEPLKLTPVLPDSPIEVPSDDDEDASCWY